jgi:hypothetical protein
VFKICYTLFRPFVEAKNSFYIKFLKYVNQMAYASERSIGFFMLDKQERR